ncbi:MAG: hypothetical protein ACI90U_001850 [Pseudomonadales bacterium]|jgi:hypothetical protein
MLTNVNLSFVCLVNSDTARFNRLAVCQPLTKDRQIILMPSEIRTDVPLVYSLAIAVESAVQSPIF